MTISSSLPHMIAVASGKGGVGKTWLSITLCHALANAGKKVLLFDADLGLANADIQLGLTPKKDLNGAVLENLPLSRVAEPYPAGGFDVIAGRSGSGALASLPAERLTRLRADLAEFSLKYDHVILDLGAGIERAVRLIALKADAYLVVTNDEPTSLTDAYTFIKVTHFDRKQQADLRIVVNMAENRQQAEKTHQTLLKACQNFLQFSPPMAGIIPRDPKVPEAIRNQTPLLVRHPNCPAAEGVYTLLENWANRP
jgi:flagellar biosynthesis protein FlhG